MYTDVLYLLYLLSYLVFTCLHWTLPTGSLDFTSTKCTTHAIGHQVVIHPHILTLILVASPFTKIQRYTFVVDCLEKIHANGVVTQCYRVLGVMVNNYRLAQPRLFPG